MSSNLARCALDAPPPAPGSAPHQGARRPLAGRSLPGRGHAVALELALLLVLLLAPASAASEPAEASPEPHAPPETAEACSSEAHRAFDFWLGNWEVATPEGRVVGRNVIRAIHDGCALHESYENSGGYEGSSLNAFDVHEERWVQTWIDNRGTLLRLEGGLEGETMVLSGPGRDAAGDPLTHRITWERLPDGRVRQSWDLIAPSGETTRVFTGLYRRL